MLNVTPEFAALIAQVFPTLLIAILIEGRIRIQAEVVWIPWYNLAAQLLRGVAVIAGAVTTFMCLSIASGSIQPSQFNNWLVTAAAWALLVALMAAVGHIIGTEKTGVGAQLAAWRKAKKEKDTEANVPSKIMAG